MEKILTIDSMIVMNVGIKYVIIVQTFVSNVTKVSVMDVITIIKKLVNK
ncbi:MAG: hypothetical protein HWN79_06390 [Candidatus Lokiarchaeota archaeon]|nr:hypothetical protein [Candidatus Lokiarchaeota archaeon]